MPELYELRSPAFLSTIVAILNREERRQGNRDSNKQTINEGVARINKRMELTRFYHTTQIEIGFTSETPLQATTMANIITGAFGDYLVKVNKEQAARSIAVLQHEFNEEDKQISIMRTNVAGMRQIIGMQNTAYANEKAQLHRMVNFHQLVAEKIKQTEMEGEHISKTSLVQIVAKAEPPKHPAGPNRILGAVLLVTGLFPMVGGFQLLKSARRQTK
jgi:uncharacterized protein involved in exopolysaccharide biosynthesis